MSPQEISTAPRESWTFLIVLSKLSPVETILGEITNAQEVVPPEKIQTVLVVQNIREEGTLKLLSHVLQRRRGNSSTTFQQPNSHIGIYLDVSPGQLFLTPERQFVVDHPVVSQGKGPSSISGLKGVIVVILFGTSLGGHPGVSHNPARVSGRMWK